MLVELTSSAEADVVSAALYLEAKQEGLGTRFEQQLDRILRRLESNPRQYPRVHEDVHRALLKVFPFSVYYLLFPERVRVFAVLHQHQHPDTWRHRF